MLTALAARRAEHKRYWHAAGVAASSGTLIPVSDKRVYRATFLVALARELPGVFTVLATGASALQGEHTGAGRALAAAELIAGAGVLTAIWLEARHLFGRHRGTRAHEHADGEHAHSASQTHVPRVDRSKLAAAALGYVEVWHHARVVGHLKLVSPNVVAATVSLVLAFSARRIVSASRRRLRQLHVAVTPDGISYLAGPRRKWRAAWTEVAAVEHDHGELTVRLHDGQRHVLRADDHLDGEGVVTRTCAAIAVHAPHLHGGASIPASAGPGFGAPSAAPLQVR